MFRKRTVSAVALTTGDHEDEYEHLGNKYTKNSVKRDQPTDKLDDMGVIRGGFADALHERGDEVKRHQSRDNEGSPEGSSSQDHVSEEGQGKGPGVFMALGSSESSEKTELSVSDPEGIGRICSVDKGVNSDDDWSNADNRSNISSDGSVHIGLRDPEVRCVMWGFLTTLGMFIVEDGDVHRLVKGPEGRYLISDVLTILGMSIVEYRDVESFVKGQKTLPTLAFLKPQVCSAPFRCCYIHYRHLFTPHAELPQPTSLSATAIVHGPLAGPLLTTCITACGETPEELQVTNGLCFNIIREESK